MKPVVAPAHLPAPIVAKLYDALREVAVQPEIRDRMILLGMVPKSSPPPDKLQDYINSEMVRWGKVVQTAGLAHTE